MRTIDPNTIYTVAEVGEIIHGIVNIEMLRRHGGLVSMPGSGYWGADLIYAINTMQEERRKKKFGSLPAPGRGDHLKVQPRLLIVEQAIRANEEPGSPEAADQLNPGAGRPSPRPPMKSPPFERRQPVPNQKQKLRILAAKLKE
jgi:hypothetical protein